MREAKPVSKKRKAINGCRKGKAFEREVAAWLRIHGFPDAERTEQHCGKAGDSDVRSPMWLPNLFFECKSVKGMDVGTKALQDAMDQAERDCPVGMVPVVVWKRYGTSRILFTFYMDFAGVRELVTCEASAAVLMWLNDRAYGKDDQ